RPAAGPIRRPGALLMHDGPTFRPFAEPLRLAAIELTGLARQGDELQRVIARLAERAGVLDQELVVDAQAADLLSQRLAGMAAFLRHPQRPGPGGPGHRTHDALAERQGPQGGRQLRRPQAGPPDRDDAADPLVAERPAGLRELRRLLRAGSQGPLDRPACGR